MKSIAKKNDYTLLIVGKKIRGLASAENYPCPVLYFDTINELFSYMQKESTRFEDLVLFVYGTKREIVKKIIQDSEELFPYFFTFIPTVLCCDFSILSRKLQEITKFDYVVSADLTPADVLSIADFVHAKKLAVLNQKKVDLIHQAIVYDLYNQYREKGMVDESGISSLPGFYFGVDEKGIIQSVTDEVLSILGFSQNEIIGKHFSELIVQDEFERVRRAFSERRTGKRGSHDVTVKFKTKDGKIKEFVVDAQGIHIPMVREHPERNPLRQYVGTFGRVHEKIQKRRTDRVIDVFQNTNEPLFIYCIDSNQLLINKGVERFLGYKPEEVYKKDPSFFEKKEHIHFNEAMKLTPDKPHISYDTVLKRKTGEEIVVEVAIDRIVFNDETYLVGMYRDITQFMRAIDEADNLLNLSWVLTNASTLEELASISVEKINAILHVPAVFIGFVRKKKDSIGRIYGIFGEKEKWYRPREKPFIKVIMDICKEAIRENRTQYRNAEDKTFIDMIQNYQEFRNFGTIIAVPLIIENRPLGCLAVCSTKDESWTLHWLRIVELAGNVIASGIHRLSLNNELQETLATLEQRVKERTQELQDFVYTVSHDLKSPLYAAKSFADMIKEQYGSVVEGEEDAYVLRRVGENIQQAIVMIDDLLTLSRVGTNHLTFEMINLEELFSEYLVEFNALRRDEIELHLNIEKPLPVIYGDKKRIAQLFTNLFDNSIKYRKNHKVQIKVSGKKKKGRVIITVEDNGQGIKKEDLFHVFKVFYRGKVLDENHMIEGSGCGLTIAKKIVELHGGKIQIKSEPEKWTRVILEFPQSYES